MPIFDFKCSDCGNTIEKLTSYDTFGISCDCGGIMKRQIGMPQIKLDGTNPDFPGAYNKWGTDRDKRAAEYRKKSYYEG